MASLAGLAERALMDVIEPMAAVTTRLQNDLGHILGRVTRMTIEPFVGARQRILGLRRVIEAPARPTIWIVTKGAIGPEPTFVKLILVATAANRARVLERSGAVTLFAGDYRVAADERKARQIMIECDRLVP